MGALTSTINSSIQLVIVLAYLVKNQIRKKRKVLTKKKVIKKIRILKVKYQIIKIADGVILCL